MNKKQLLVFVALCVFLPVNAQEKGYPCRYCADYNQYLRQGLSGQVYNNPVPGFLGERYFGEWRKGTLYFENGDSVTGVDLRYEKYLDELLFLNGELRAGVLQKSGIKGFTIYNDRGADFVFSKRNLKLSNDTDTLFHFMQELIAGKVSLYVNRKAVKSDNGRLEKADQYYLCHAGTYYQVRLRRKELLRLPFVTAQEMKILLRKGGIRVNDEAGLVKVITFYNEYF